MATNGFFGKVKEMFRGKADRKAGVAHEHYIQRVTSNPTPRGRSMTRGAFGGTGTGRGMRGMPGRKLIKKTVKAGWKAHNRVTLSTRPVQKAVTGGRA
jgi:hypothetical protein